MSKAKGLSQQYEKVSRYLMIGVLTTIVGYGLFYICHYPAHMEVNLSNAISIIGAVAFAYILNKQYVFHSKCVDLKALALEALSFVSSRAVTMLIEFLGVFLLATVAGLPGMAAKVAVGVIVVILNYVFSNRFVFKNQSADSGENRDLPVRSLVQNNQDLIIWGAFTAAVITLACLFPLSGDDWQWALHKGISTINGRYLGNLTAMLLTQNLWLKPIIVGMTISFIVYLSATIAGKKHTIVWAAFLIGFIPTPVFTQTFQWTSGFANYTMPVLFLLIYGRILQMAEEQQTIHLFFYPGIFVVASGAQLFVENITVAMLAFGLVVCVYTGYAKRPSFRLALTAFLGFVLGGGILLSNPSYHTAVDGAHTMPGFSDMIASVSDNYFDIIVPHLIMNNLVLNLSLCGLTAFLIYRSDLQGRKLSKVLIVFFSLMGAYLILRTLHPALLRPSIAAQAEGVISVIYILALCLSLYRYLPAGEEKRRIFFLILALAFINAPLFGLTPIGPRCFLVSYMIMSIIAMTLYSYLNQSFAFSLGRLPVKLLVSALLIGVFVTYTFIYGYISFVVHSREAQIEEQLLAGREHIAVQRLPFSEYVWHGDPLYEYAEGIFKAYYQIPANYTVEITGK